MCRFHGVYELTKVLLRNYPKIGHVSVEIIAGMSWRRRVCDHSCLPSRNHHANEESWKVSRLIKTKYREWFKLINTQRAQVVPRGIKWSHGMVSIVCYALWTNPWSTWEFYVGLGMFPWACVKRNISYNPWRGWHQVVIVIKIAVCKFKWSNSKSGSPIMEYGGAIKLESCRSLWCQWNFEDVPKSGSPIVEYGGAIN